MKKKKPPVEPHYHEGRTFNFKEGILTITKKECRKKVCDKPLLVVKDAAPDQWPQKRKRMTRLPRQCIDIGRTLETSIGPIRITESVDLSLFKPTLTEAVMPEVRFDVHGRTWVDGK